MRRRKSIPPGGPGPVQAVAEPRAFGVAAPDQAVAEPRALGVAAPTRAPLTPNPRKTAAGTDRFSHIAASTPTNAPTGGGHSRFSRNGASQTSAGARRRAKLARRGASAHPGPGSE